MLIAGSFSSVCVYVSRSISKKIKHAGNDFREGKNPIDLQNYKSYKSKIMIGHKIIARINLFFRILCHSAIVQVEVKESRLDICFCHGSRSQWPSAQCIFTNICLLRLMVMNLWKRQPPPFFFFLPQNSSRKYRNNLVYYSCSYSSCGSECDGNSRRYISANERASESNFTASYWAQTVF